MARYAKFFSVGAGGGGTNNLQLPIGTILDTTLRQVQDGTGTGSPLYLSTQRVGITSDSSVTTQVSSVIQATTTNANLVIAPNGTGALLAQIPDGTATGGDARGTNAIDFQLTRNFALMVASGNYSTILGGRFNRATAEYSFVGSGNQNQATGQYAAVLSGNFNNSIGTNSFIGGGQSNVNSSNFGVISGGQSNTASTNTHATVVGGQSNVSSGQYSVSGGFGNTASGLYAVALGYNNQATSTGNISLGFSNTVSGNTSMAGPRNCVASSEGTVALGFAAQATGGRSYAIGSANTASGGYSVSIGANNNSYNTGMITTYMGDAFTTQGDCQRSMVTQRYVGDFSTGGTGTLNITAGSSTSALIPSGNDRAWNVQVNWVAVVTSITGTATGISVGDVITSVDLLAFKKIAGVSSASTHTSAGTKTMVTTPAAYVGCQITYAASTGQRLELTFTAPVFAGGGTVNMRVVATLELTEVAF